MVLAEVVDSEKGREILDRLIKLNPEKGMDYMKYYWGGMLDLGADTFWKLYNPENPAESPYGSSIVNSYCHAWSCTPTYLLRKYFI